MNEKLHISSEETTAANDDRFHRFGLIGWWDQKRLAQAKVLVVGAGALGNEIIKNLALLGVGNILIADLDTIENSNLSRSILYRQADNGRPKAEVAAEAARDIYPDINVHSFCGNIVHDLGMAVYRWADVVLGGLDNREARLAINRSCYRVGRTFIDGAIEQIQGCARVFQPDGPCYECTMSKVDWQMLEQRRSCNLLTRQEMAGGRTPTTPTISSIIAGMQCQEAVKHLHNMPTMAGKGWVLDGLSGDSYQIEYQRNQECFSHDTLHEIVSLNVGHATITVGDLLAKVRGIVGEEIELEIGRDVLEKLVCPNCQREEAMFTSLGGVKEDAAWCPHCDDTRRNVVTFYKIRGDEPFLDRTLQDIGVPAYDILIARTTKGAFGFELTDDAQAVLGPLVGGEEELAWS